MIANAVARLTISAFVTNAKTRHINGIKPAF
jgi:hypothetical protein